MRKMFLIASLLGCDGSIVDDQVWRPVEDAPRCELPEIGDTCPYLIGDIAMAEATISEHAFCLDPNADLVRSIFPGDVIEYACEPLSGLYRYVAGSYAPNWGLTFMSREGSLIYCSARDGLVADIYPLISDGNRLWHAIQPEDTICLDMGSCVVASEPCSLDR